MILPDASQGDSARLRISGVPALLAAIALAGCGRVPPPDFKLNVQGVDLVKLAEETSKLSAQERKAVEQQRQDMVNVLTAAFGTPDKPYVLPETKLDLLKLQFAAGPISSDERGIEKGLYRKHCVHCHGISGDGAGPTARFLDPYPRDYRQGVFKFTSTGPGAKPLRADLKRTLVEGIPGTAMPSFMLLADHEIEALVEYVIYLSMRGQTEELLNLAVGGEEPLPTNREEIVALVEPIAADWAAAEEAIVVPVVDNLPPLAPLASTAEEEAHRASVERGKQLFLGDVAKCASCHGPSGLGDGSGEPLYDDWNKVKPDNNLVDNDTGVRPIIWWNLPKQQLDPRNLRLGIYRGGRRPMDLYRRIAAGIKGTPMPAGGNVLKPEEIWDLVNYVRSLPFETERRVANEFAKTAGHEARFAQRSKRQK